MTQAPGFGAKFAKNQIRAVRSGLNITGEITRFSREMTHVQNRAPYLGSTRTTIAGIAVLVVVSDASLSAQAMKLIPIAAIVGFIIAIPLSFMVTKRIS